MADGVLLDTSFLITFVTPTRQHHAVALQYFRLFVAEGIPMFVSTVVASEFHLRQPITDLPLEAMIVLPFNLTDAIRAAELNFALYKGPPGIARDALKDDFKLLGQAKANDIAFLITEDDRSLYRFSQELRAKRQLTTRAIKLDAGFDRSHFDPAGQHDFDSILGTDSPPGV